MRRAARFLALACAMVLALATGRAAAQDSGPPTMIIAGPGSQLSTIAVSGLKSLGGDDDHRVGNAFVSTLRRDLELSGFFRIIDPHAYIEDPQTSGFELGQLILPTGDRSTPTLSSRAPPMSAAMASSSPPTFTTWRSSG